MTMQGGIRIAGLISLLIIMVIVIGRKRPGSLNAATWLTLWGALILAIEHPMFAIAYSVPLPSIVEELRNNPMPLLPHA